MANLYYIENVGCDDTTHGLARMTDEEFATFKRIVENLNKNSTYGCMPTIVVYKIDESFIRQAKDDDGSNNFLYMDDVKYVLDEYLYAYNLTENGYDFSLKEGVERVI